jgi:hypothetical protein
MRDRDGKIVHEFELVKIVDLPDFHEVVAFWVIFDCVQYGIFTDFVLKNCVTNEIKIVPQQNIQRTY